METRSKNIIKVARRLFSELSEIDAFAESLSADQREHVAVLWVTERPTALPFVPLAPFDFQPPFVDCVPWESRPSGLPQHAEGCFYVLDSSSVFCAAALSAIGSIQGPLLDLCAAPGGKSVAAWAQLHPKLMVCNEVIGKRLPALISNLRRLQISPAVVCSSDSSWFAAAYPRKFAVVLCDVPCSGQSLLARGQGQTGTFHPATINSNSRRQRRIAANAVQTVAPGGYLLYSTCTFAIEENEAIVEWLVKKFPHLEACMVDRLAPYQSTLSALPCYRLYPQQKKGAGGFVCLLRSREEGQADAIDLSLIRPHWTAGVELSYSTARPNNTGSRSRRGGNKGSD